MLRADLSEKPLLAMKDFQGHPLPSTRPLIIYFAGPCGGCSQDGALTSSQVPKKFRGRTILVRSDTQAVVERKQSKKGDLARLVVDPKHTLLPGRAYTARPFLVVINEKNKIASVSIENLSSWGELQKFKEIQ